MVTRRGFLRGAVGLLSATVAAFAVRKGVDAHESVPEGVMALATQGEAHYAGPADSISRAIFAGPFPDYDPAFPLNVDMRGGIGHATLVTGPNPDTYVYVELGFDGVMRVIPPALPSPSENQTVHGMGIPRADFPEFDPKHGIVTLDRSIFFDAWHVPSVRAAYQYALGQRQPDRPLDGNHLSVRFMPKALWKVQATLDGVDVPHIGESYDGLNGWLVQFAGVFGNSPRYRILTGNVTHTVDGVAISPGDYTAPRLR